ncbi:hypothetical protein GCM10023195_61520 [Actinoallomurus liliacearum]|uniref:Uncharacterized protein n=1 Tax=Actinoallomurus liliacearum TaxID=1080073 RepID=A0ABP8TQJ4_9ACTN
MLESQRLARVTLRQMIESGNDSSRVLKAKLIARSDDDRSVVATANGLGELVTLTFAEHALRHPSTLGQRTTSAIIRARAAGRQFGEKFDDLKYPVLGSLRNLGEIVFDSSIYENFDRIDYPDEGTRNTIAECAEVLRSMTLSVEAFEDRLVRSVIGSELGYVAINLADTKLIVSFEMIRATGISNQRFAERVVDAFRSAQLEAQRLRLQSLRDFSLWWRRQAPNTEIIGDNDV